MFQNQVEEKLIRDRTGHRSNALFKYEKSSVQQQMMVSNLLGPPVANLTDSASTNTPSTKVSLSKTDAAESNSNLLDLESLRWSDTRGHVAGTCRSDI